MYRLKLAIQKAPAWLRSLVLLLVLFVGAALGLPRILHLIVNLSQSTQTTLTSQVRITPTYAPTPAAANPPACTAIGQHWTSPADNMTVVCVPAGDFQMGSSSEASTRPDNEKPQHTVYLDAFWIDKTDVTNAQYALCVASGSCQAPIVKKSHVRDFYYGNSEYNDYPVLEVTWEMADQYCKWASRKLPTEAEWEKAARGTDGMPYPWGNSDPQDDLLNYNTNLNETSPVCQYPSGNSPYGACDMAGNVWQWVNDWYNGGGYSAADQKNPTGPVSGNYKVLKGSQWGSPKSVIHSSTRRWRLPNLWSYNIGFRCAVKSK